MKIAAHEIRNSVSAWFPNEPLKPEPGRPGRGAAVFGADSLGNSRFVAIFEGSKENLKFRDRRIVWVRSPPRHFVESVISQANRRFLQLAYLALGLAIG